MQTLNKQYKHDVLKQQRSMVQKRKQLFPRKDPLSHSSVMGSPGWGPRHQQS